MRQMLIMLIALLLTSCFQNITNIEPKANKTKGELEEQLFKAIEINDLRLFKTLIDKIETADLVYGTLHETPLHYACRYDREEIVKILIERGEAINAKDISGQTPLYYSSWRGNSSISKLLLESGVEVSVKDEHGTTPLHHATKEANILVVELLLEKGVEVNVKDCFGDTALHYAFYRGYMDIAKLLIKKGASLNIVNKKGYSPIGILFELSRIEEKNRPLFISLINHELKIYRILLKERVKKLIEEVLKQFEADGKLTLEVIKALRTLRIMGETIPYYPILDQIFEYDTRDMEDVTFEFIIKNPEFKFSREVFDKIFIEIKTEIEITHYSCIEKERLKYRSYSSIDIIKLSLDYLLEMKK